MPYFRTFPEAAARKGVRIMPYVFLLTSLAAVGAFELPADYDVMTYCPSLAGVEVELDAPRYVAELAEGLVAHGTPEALALAERALEAVLATQELRPGAARHGNFLWRFGDAGVTDLNSVEFTLRCLVPMMIHSGDRLSGDMQARVRRCIRFGLEEIRRMDVAVTYTNVASMDCMNSILGGELLRDAALAERGYEKLKALEAVTLAHGTFYEFNPPVYTQVTHDAYSRLARYTVNEEAAVRARALRARLLVTAALHWHPSTGQLGGPQGRGIYYLPMEEIEPYTRHFEEWMRRGDVPAGFGVLLSGRPMPYSVWESVYPEWELGMTTYMDEGFVMGTATAEISRQTHAFLLHAAKESGEGVVVYAKYLLDDPEDVEKTDTRHLVVEQGKFRGVQSGRRMLGLYAPRVLEHPGSLSPASLSSFESAKVTIEFRGLEEDAGVWIGERRIEAFPAEASASEAVVVECGAAYLALLPLSRDDMGVDAPLRVVRREKGLAFEMYNYLGPRVTPWEMDRNSRFFQGRPRAGFFAETARREEYADGAAFARTVAQGTLQDVAQPPVTSYRDEKERLWTAEYARDGERIGIEIDLLHWRLKRRWTEKGALGWPMMVSPLANQNAEGHVEAGGASLDCGAAPAWLVALPEQQYYLAGYHGAKAPLTLRTPEGHVSVEACGTGVIAWRQGQVTVDALFDGAVNVEGAALAGASR